MKTTLFRTLGILACLGILVANVMLTQEGITKQNIFLVELATASSYGDELPGDDKPKGKECKKAKCSVTIGNTEYKGHYWHCATVEKVSSCSYSSCYVKCDAGPNP